MAKKAPQRGEKAEWIREALTDHPNKGPKEIADMLTERATKGNIDLSFKPAEVSSYKQKAKESGSGGKTKKAALAKPGQEATGYADKLMTIKGLVQEMGAAEVKKLVDVLS